MSAILLKCLRKTSTNVLSKLLLQRLLIQVIVYVYSSSLIPCVLSTYLHEVDIGEMKLTGVLKKRKQRCNAGKPPPSRVAPVVVKTEVPASEQPDLQSASPSPVIGVEDANDEWGQPGMSQGTESPKMTTALVWEKYLMIPQNTEVVETHQMTNLLKLGLLCKSCMNSPVACVNFNTGTSTFYTNDFIGVTHWFPVVGIHYLNHFVF